MKMYFVSEYTLFWKIVIYLSLIHISHLVANLGGVRHTGDLWGNIRTHVLQPFELIF